MKKYDRPPLLWLLFSFSQSCKLKSSKQNSPRKHRTPHRQSLQNPQTPAHNLIHQLCSQSKFSDLKQWFSGDKEKWGFELKCQSIFASRLGLCCCVSCCNQASAALESWGWDCRQHSQNSAHLRLPKSFKIKPAPTQSLENGQVYLPLWDKCVLVLICGWGSQMDLSVLFLQSHF